MVFGYLYRYQELDELKLKYIAGTAFGSFILDLPWLVLFGGVTIK
jgi:hypothetical protein